MLVRVESECSPRAVKELQITEAIMRESPALAKANIGTIFFFSADTVMT